MMHLTTAPVNHDPDARCAWIAEGGAMGQLDVEAAYAAPLVSDSPAATRMRRAAVEMLSLIHI